jgi:hypothetical protein
MLPQSTLNKRHNVLSYHRVRECIASGIIYFMHVEGRFNPSDILKKFFGWTKFWPLIQPLLFWKGETLLNETIGQKPLPVLIKDTKDSMEDPASAVWGVTDDNPSSGSKRKSESRQTPKTPLKSDHVVKSYEKPNSNAHSP